MRPSNNNLLLLLIFIGLLPLSATAQTGNYKIVDTGQEGCFNNLSLIITPLPGTPFYGQDAQHQGNQPAYQDNGDGTVTDLITGLVWQKGYEVLTYKQALDKVKKFELAGHSDWRLPTIKEAYSLMLFSGKDISGPDMRNAPQTETPFIDTDYFDFEYGSNGQRPIDVQLLSSTMYTGTTMGGQTTVFGVNVADGRIKGYPLTDPRSRSGKQYTVRFVRGNPEYGQNHFQDNGDGTISDLATQLMWQQTDSKVGMNWEDALAWVEEQNKENYLGHNDWRLPNAKELQSIVDYTRSPQATNSPALDPLFACSPIKDEGGNVNYPAFWTSTTHQSQRRGETAVYIAFGEALGFFGPPHSRQKTLMDVHGAGAQRSDPKSGDASQFPQGRGPQGDVIRIENYVRMVRDL